MKLFAIFGNPVSHSKSPRMYNKCFEFYGLNDYCYTRTLLKDGDKIIDTFNYIGISIDGTKEQHDFFRGQKGSYDKAIDGIKHIQKAGGNAVIRFTLTKETQKSFYFMFDFMVLYTILISFTYCNLLW